MTPTNATITAGAPAWLISGVAALVLSLATGAPLRSVPHLMPHAGEQDWPHLGI